MSKSSVLHNNANTKTAKNSNSSAYHTNARAVWLGRVLFLGTLCVVAGVFGYFSYRTLQQSERRLADAQFDAIAGRSNLAAVRLVARHSTGTAAVVAVAAYGNPDAASWPNVAMRGFEQIGVGFTAAASGRAVGLVPLVSPAQLQAFEDFAYTYYNTTREPPFPPNFAVSDFGRGVFSVDATLDNATDQRYHDTTGATTYHSPNAILTPLFQQNEGAYPLLMINMHYDAIVGGTIDSVIACAAQRASAAVVNGTNTSAATNTTTNATTAECGQMSVIFDALLPGPGAVLFLPIYPAHDPTVLTGFIVSSILWSDVLQDAFGTAVSGIHCVLQCRGESRSYSVTGGIVAYLGRGDLHSPAYTIYGQRVSLTGGLFGADSPAYTLTLYPSGEFFDIYSTDNPWTATIGAVVIILVTSVLFILYDYCVRREFTAKSGLLDAKRKYMRFVSHEVRTPLNSLCLGLALLRDEMGAALAGHRVAGCGAAAPDGGDDSGCGAAASSSATSAPTTSGGGGAGDVVAKSRVDEWLTLEKEIFLSAQNAVGVLNDLLNYDKIEMGRLSLELTVIPIEKLVQQTTKEFNLPAAKRQIKYSVEFVRTSSGSTAESASKSEHLSGALTTTDTEAQHRETGGDMADRKVVGDPVRLAQCLRNLISNALKFNSDGGTLTVLVSAVDDRPKPVAARHRRPYQKFTLQNGSEVSFRRTGFVEIAVSDTGAGMSKDQLGRLFRDGVQFNVNKLQAGQGSGLGLYITKGIVEQHGGSLTVESEGLNKGATFTMSLPLYDTPADASMAISDRAESERYGEDAKGSEPIMPLRILVVDDSDMNRRLLTRLLQNCGHQCDQAGDGVEAVNRVKQAYAELNPYDTILLDYEMPIMNGPTAAQEIRALHCDSFIVGITGNVLPEDVLHFKLCGANDVLPKPFRMSALEKMWAGHEVANRKKALSVDGSSGRFRGTGGVGEDDDAAAPSSTILGDLRDDDAV